MLEPGEPAAAVLSGPRVVAVGLGTTDLCRAAEVVAVRTAIPTSSIPGPSSPNVLAARARKSECFVNLSAQSGGLEAPSRNMRLRSVPPNLNHWEEGDDEDDDVDEDLDEASGPGSCVPSAWG